MVVGERADADVVREGAAAAVVEAEFDLNGEAAARVGALMAEWGLDFDGATVIVRREAQANGRGRASVNQSPVTLAALKRLGEIVADLHGQHEHQSLLKPEAGLLVLDRLAGLEEQRQLYCVSLAAWREARADLERLEASLATFAERSEYLRHAAHQIDQARLADDELETLERDAARLAHADRLRALASQALEGLSESETSAGASLASALHALEQAARLDPSLADGLPPLHEAGIAMAEAARTLTDYVNQLEVDPSQLDAIEARRDSIHRLTRTYRRNVSELQAWRTELERELAAGDDAAGARERAGARLMRAEAECLQQALSLGAQRAAAAATWGTRLTRELKPLGFASARLAFDVARPREDARGFGPLGLDAVTIRFTANAGEPPKPLAKIASGGELSRVMLALKAALEAKDRVDLLVFDEVDSGIGGAVAQAVGERLRLLARHRQILCVTHLPMIAALADHHLSVTKEIVGARTLARFGPVDGEARVAELARMLAGTRASETTRRQARELLAAAPSDR
ncbi:MAG: DNA repair protein RecN [Candidatus Eisenbacteria bacterium]|uniref:DNA repair protein RecN n=1 Tax=Eiseniibacteriota bacterium TaxID=2212470 RepID=A0A538TXS1_UNCEI|nr:MAG: DNA repair protein RecN [Candidatus Eisenbacteria bacterium]